MRIKIFTAATIHEALTQVRETLGEDAVIINTEEKSGQVTVTAATEVPPRTDVPSFGKKPSLIKRNSLLKTSSAPETGRFKPLTKKSSASGLKFNSSPIHKSLKELEEEQKFEDEFDLEFFLMHHATSGSIRQEILALFDALEKENNLMTLAAVMDSLFTFAPLNNNYQKRPIMLIGPPGAGKTVTAAKLASQAVLKGKKCHLISTDILRTGGFAQLMGYADVLKTPISKVNNPDELKSLLTEIEDDGDLVIIDTAGYNPFNVDEMKELYTYIEAGYVEPIFIAPSGIDAYEAKEMSETYAALGAKRFIPTRLDVARRYGSLMAIAETKNLSFAGAGITPFLADGLQSLDAVTLAKLLTKIPKSKTFNPTDQA
jgi:flagellar biosynthesis protein FlhF